MSPVFYVVICGKRTFHSGSAKIKNGDMFGFRRIAYMLLSRNFYVGIGVGFFLAGLFALQISPAHAETYYADNAIKTYTSFCGRTGFSAKAEWSNSSTSTKLNLLHSDTQTSITNCFVSKQYTNSTIATTTRIYIDYAMEVNGGTCYLIAVRGFDFATYTVGDTLTVTTKEEYT